MRYGLKMLFPDISSIGAATGGAQSIQPTKTDAPTEEKKPIEVSVFSTYDGDKSSSVDYNEATSNSLFAQRWEPENKSISCDYSIAGGGNVHISSEALAEIKQNALNKYNPAAKFTEMLQSFSSKTGSQTLTFKDGIEDSNQILQARSEMDRIAKSDASAASRNANEEISRMYRAALEEAKSEYDAQNQQETEVYSSYDRNQDKTVEYNEISNEFHFDSLSGMTPTNMSQDSITIDVIRQKAMSELGFNPSEKFQSEVSSFSESYTTRAVTTGGIKTSSEFDQLQTEINQQIGRKASDLNYKVNQEIRQQYQQALDKVAANPEFTEQDMELIRMQQEERTARRSQQAPEDSSVYGNRHNPTGNIITSIAMPGGVDSGVFAALNDPNRKTSGMFTSVAMSGGVNSTANSDTPQTESNTQAQGQDNQIGNVLNGLFTSISGVSASDSKVPDNKTSEYKVKDGDTLKSIANNHDTSVNDLIEINKEMKLKPDSQLKKGMKLKVPTRHA